MVMVMKKGKGEGEVGRKRKGDFWVRKDSEL